MNKDYLYANGNIHIFDQDDNKTVVEYTDNFRERLISQNNLENYEQLMIKNEDAITNYDYELKYSVARDIFMNLSYATTGYVCPYFINFFCNLNLQNINYGDSNLMQILILISSSLSLCFGLIKTSQNMDWFRNTSKILKGRINSRNRLYKLYNNEIKKQAILLKNNNKDLEEYYKDQEIKRENLNYELIDEEIKKYFKMLVWYETNKKLIKKYYKKGNLDEILSKYTLSEIEYVNNFINEDSKMKIR